jgi:spore protease
MKHEIDLKMTNIHTDLLVEQIDKNNENIIKEETDNIKITTINVDNILEKELNKKVGTYITIEFRDITDIDNREEVGRSLVSNIKKLMDIEKIDKNASSLVIGLGNARSTPDALGSKTLENVLITRHLFLINELKEGIRSVSGFCPGVMANTGMETYDIIRGVISITKPQFLVIIDSLKASSIERVNKTIQLTNTGINPGSGIGNNRLEISKETLGIPVISIGVPTVVDASTIVKDTINYLFKHLSYIKEKSSLNKLIVRRSDYMNKIKDNDLSDCEKKEILGIVGSLSEEEQYKLIKEVLEGIDYDLIVTPKDIDFVIDKLGEVIGFSINNALSSEINSY